MLNSKLYNVFSNCKPELRNKISNVFLKCKSNYQMRINHELKFWVKKQQIPCFVLCSVLAPFIAAGAGGRGWAAGLGRSLVPLPLRHSGIQGPKRHMKGPPVHSRKHMFLRGSVWRVSRPGPLLQRKCFGRSERSFPSCQTKFVRESSSSQLGAESAVSSVGLQINPLSSVDLHPHTFSFILLVSAMIWTS